MLFTGAAGAPTGAGVLLNTEAVEFAGPVALGSILATAPD